MPGRRRTGPKAAGRMVAKRGPGVYDPSNVHWREVARPNTADARGPVPDRKAPVTLRRFRIAALLGCLAFLALGCVILPIPMPEDKVMAGRPVTEFQQSFIRPGETTREEVVRHLGQPFIIWEDARVFIYRWDMRQGILVWFAVSDRAIYGDAHDVPKHYLLLVQFDGNNVVRRFERTTRPPSKPVPDFLLDWLHRAGAPEIPGE